MAENTQKDKDQGQTTPTQTTTPPTQTEAEKDKGQETNPGTPDPGTFATADTAVAEANGISEGEVKALRDDSGLNQLAGNAANTLSWEATPAGREFLDGEKDRQKQYKDEAKRYDEATQEGGLTEAEVKFKEAVDAAKKG